MMDNLYKNLALVLSVLVTSSAIVLAVAAWTEPGGAPPGGNVAPPINTSLTEQTKQGNFNVSGNMGVGTTAPLGRLDVENGSICLNGECCSTWDECGSGGIGFDPGAYPCSSGQLPDSGAIKNRRIFVTSAEYAADDFVTTWYNAGASKPTVSDETRADAKCNAVAAAAGFTGGTFKAMVYMGKRDINTVIPDGAVFWSCNASTAEWKRVAEGEADFFSADEGGGNYLESRIYNEFGSGSSSTVWTGFNINAGGGYSLITHASLPSSSYSNGWWGSCVNGTAWWYTCVGYTCCTSSASWYGSASSITAGWAHSGSTSSKCTDYTYYSTGPWTSCASATRRSLYCVEQL